MKATIRICEDVPAANLRQLAAQVCLTALTEAKDPDPVKALDAVMWLTSADDFPFWAECAGLPFADPLALLTGGNLNRIRVRKKGKNP